MNLRLDSTHRQMEFFGNLLVGVILQKTHHKKLAVLLGQRAYILLNLRALLYADKSIFGRRGTRNVRGELLINRKVILTAAFKVDVGIAGNGVDPLTEGRFRRVALQIDLDLDEGLLQQILGILHRCRTMQQQTAYSFAITVEEILKGDIITLQRELHQTLVVGDYVVGYFHAVESLRSIMMWSATISSGLKRSKRKYFRATLFSPTRFAIERTRSTTKR